MYFNGDLFRSGALSEAAFIVEDGDAAERNSPSLGATLRVLEKNIGIPVVVTQLLYCYTVTQIVIVSVYFVRHVLLFRYF